VRTAWLTVALAAVLAGVAVVLALAGFTRPAAWGVAAPLGAASYLLWNRGRERMIADLYDFDFEVEAGPRESTEDWHRDWPPDDDVGSVGDVEEPWEDWEWAQEADGRRPGDGPRSRDRDRTGDRDRSRERGRGRARDRTRRDPGRRRSPGATDGGSAVGSGAAADGPRTVDPEIAEARRVLGVDPDADEEEIRRAYRERVKETHPDAGGSRESFERVQWAYERLTDGRQ